MTSSVGIITVAMTVAFPAMVSAFCQGWATKSAMDGMSRQPETSGDVRTTLLLALAFMEALTLFAFVVAILLWVKL
jgi:F-type H+-transporting ATPase subunit c